MSRNRNYRILPAVATCSLIVGAVLCGHLPIRAYEFGITGHTEKTGEDGCSCHSLTSDPTTSVAIVAATPQSNFTPGITYDFKVIVHNASRVASGVDIAARYGQLTPGESDLYLSLKEVTHRSPKVFVHDSAVWLFHYTAPFDVLSDTIFATGNAVNLSGNETGDSWNFAPKFVVHLGSEAVNPRLESAASNPIAYPNPANRSVSFILGDQSPDNLTLQLFDEAGREVAKPVIQIASAGGVIRISTEELHSGRYLLRMTNRSGTLDDQSPAKTISFVVQH